MATVEFRGKKWSLMERYDIPNVTNFDETYLTRWRIIQTPWFGVFIHKIMCEDTIDMEHTHPWSFVSLILRGGYEERKLHRSRMRRVGSVGHMVPQDTHTIARLFRVPTWTLVFVGSRYSQVKDWYFWDEGRKYGGPGLVSHKDVFKQLGIF